MAVQNAVNWIESHSWDGRYAVVVTTDSSTYSTGPARPTSGAGAVALLLGPEAPLAFERGLQATYMTNTYDFYKPAGLLYPVVDGPLSVQSYMEALDEVYQRFAVKFAHRRGKLFSMAEADYSLFHAPYNKLVQKAYSRLMYLDLVRAANANGSCLETSGIGKGNEDALLCSDDDGNTTTTTTTTDQYPVSPPTVTVPLGGGAHPLPPSQMPKELEKALFAQSFEEYDRKVRPSTCIARLCGNMYTASLWSGIAQLIETTGADLEGKRLLLFSYGSGLAATAMTMVGRRVEGQFSLGALQGMSDLAMRLARRVPAKPEEFERAMTLNEVRYGTTSYCPKMPAVADLEPGTYYLSEVDSKYRRKYCFVEFNGK